MLKYGNESSITAAGVPLLLEISEFSSQEMGGGSWLFWQLMRDMNLGDIKSRTQRERP